MAPTQKQILAKLARENEPKRRKTKLDPFKLILQRRKTLKKARRVKRFINKTKKDIVGLLAGDIDTLEINANLAKPLTLINTIFDTVGGQKVVIKLDGDRFYTLSQKNMEHIIDLVGGSTEIEVSGSDREFALQILDEGVIELQRWEQDIFGVDVEERNEREAGGFFRYKHTLNATLERFGIFKEIKKDNYEINCLIRALQNGGMLEYKLNQLKCCVKNREVQLSKLNEVCKKLKIHIQVYSNSKTKYYGDKSSKEVYKLGLLDRHYFIREETNLTSYSIKHHHEVKGLPKWNQIYKKDSQGRYKRDTSKFIDSYKIISLLLEHKDDLLIEISQVDSEILQTPYYMEIDNIANLEYDNEINCKETIYKEPKESDHELVFFDFETYVKNTKHKCTKCLKKKDGKVCKNDTNGEHVPYLCRAVKEDGTSFKCFEGVGCGKMFLDSLTTNSHLIAHNASYDVQFLAKYLFNITVIEKGHNLYTMQGRYNKHSIKITDSLKMIPEALRKFPEMFGLGNIQKEIMNYNIYTAESIRVRYMNIEDVKNTFKDVEDQKQFIKNINKWGIKIGDKFDIVKYSSEYCLIDCQVLRLGYLKFREWMKEVTDIDINDCLTIASLVDKYFIKEGCYNEVNQFSGVVREFMQKCVVGGRVMVANNKKNIVEGKVSDFDAVSLYPSAMFRMDGFLKGNPKVIEEEHKNLEFLEQQDGYFINISIDKVGKELRFPLISVVNNETGIREFTNLTTNNYYVDKIGFEDLIKYQEVEYTINRGYYFDEGRNDKVKEVIQHLFNERLQKKKEKNPIQVVYKLIMNSSYGKTIMKAVDSDTRVFNTSTDMFKYTNYNYNIVKGMIKMKGCKKWKVESIKTINDHFSRPHVGVEILSMSKRIMNEVMCLSEDMGINIYYQDTDSMHIDTDNIEKLSEAFQDKYERKLIGKNMGQFHSDFDFKDADKDAEINAIKSIFLGKKTYIDLLESTVDGKKAYDYHIRMKGVPNQSIHHTVEVNELESPIELYQNLFDGEVYNFDLLCGGERCNFKYNKNMTVSSQSKFSRNIKFN
jgi:hypothetical protein